MKIFNTEETMKEIHEKIRRSGCCNDELGFISPYHNKIIRNCLGREQLVIFGAGVYGELILKDLLDHKANNICCFCDNKQAGTALLGYDVLTPAEAFEKYPQATFVITPRLYENEILWQLDDIGVRATNIIIVNMLETGLEII